MNIEQLPHGRHGLSREHVERNQRGRLLDATRELAVERGFAAVTVTSIVERARISRRAFYEYFDNRNDVLIQTFTERPEVDIPTGIETLDQDGWRLVRKEIHE